jgi:hypothetical protein
MQAGNCIVSQTEFKRCRTGLDLAEATRGWLYNCRFVKCGAGLLTSSSKTSINQCDFIKNEFNIAGRDTRKDLMPSRKIYSLSAYLSGSRLVPSKAISTPPPPGH